ncbi:hypothetical protein V8E55_008362 [Tylopilus felleus]
MSKTSRACQIILEMRQNEGVNYQGKRRRNTYLQKTHTAQMSIWQRETTPRASGYDPGANRTCAIARRTRHVEERARGPEGEWSVLGDVERDWRGEIDGDCIGYDEIQQVTSGATSAPCSKSKRLEMEAPTGQGPGRHEGINYAPTKNDLKTTSNHRSDEDESERNLERSAGTEGANGLTRVHSHDGAASDDSNTSYTCPGRRESTQG